MGTKADARVVQPKKDRGFFWHVFNGKVCCVLSALLRDDLSMDAYSLRIIIYIIDLKTRARLRLAAELPCLFLTSEALLYFSGFFADHCVVLFGWTAINHSISIGNDWHRRRISNSNRYSILSRGRQLQVFLLLQTYEKRFAEFPFL